MKGLYSRSVRPSQQRETPPTEPSSLEGSSSTGLESSGSTFYDSSVIISPEIRRGGNQSDSSGKPRKNKLEKIGELLEENRKLKDKSWKLQQEVNQKEMQIRHGTNSQIASGEGTKEGKPHEKHIEALRALTAVTKTQQESLAAHQERYEELSREYEEREYESKRLRKDLHKKKKEVTMLEKEIDSNLLEITGLRKELAHALQTNERSETELRGDRRTILELTRELALAKAGQEGASDDVKMVSSRITSFDEEIKEKEDIIGSQRIELEKHVTRIQKLHADLERSQDQVKAYEKERDATVAEMETYYEALKYELEEKSRLLEEAEKEKKEIDIETTAALRALQERCDLLNTEVLDAHDEMSVLRRENDASSFASIRSGSASIRSGSEQKEFEEERRRLNSNLEAMSAELNELKQRNKEMGLEHDEAYNALEQENGELKLQHTEFRAALREANVRNRTITEKNEMMQAENESLLEISKDLQLKLREEQASKEHVSSVVDDATSMDHEQVGGQDQVKEAGTKLVDSASSSMTYSSMNLEPVPEDDEGSNVDDIDAEEGSGDSSDTGFSDEAVTGTQASPTSSDNEQPTGQHALLLAATQAQSSPADSDDEPTGQQALLLAAAAGRKLQKAQSEKPVNSSWRSMKLRKRGQNDGPLPPLAGGNVSSSTSSDTDSQIENLQKINQEQTETIKKLKSELVRLNSFYRDAAYVSKRKIENLAQENAAYEIKIVVLEKMLEKLGGPGESLIHSSEASVGDNDSRAKETVDDASSVRSETSSQEEVTPQRDWSSPPKFLDRIKELEGKVSTLEKEKNNAEQKAELLLSDLEGYQRASKEAALNSLLEIERLKRENSEKESRLSAFEEGRGEGFEMASVGSERLAVGENDD